MSIIRNLAGVPVLGPILMIPFRLKVGLSHVLRPLGSLGGWLFRSNEYTNFTYDLTDRNKSYLCAFVSRVTSASPQEVEGYITELENDQELLATLREAVEQSAEGRFTDVPARFARRMAWYAMARMKKPKVIVETGVDKGLGAAVLCAALRRNHEEGYPGCYFGTDIQPRSGFLLTGEYADYGEILIGDSIESLKTLDVEIDLFINDSDHSAKYEADEYTTVESKLSRDALVIGDNAHVTDELFKFAQRTGRDFLFFREEPKAHWYGGGG